MTAYWQALERALGGGPAEARPRPRSRFETFDAFVDVEPLIEIEEEIAQSPVAAEPSARIDMPALPPSPVASASPEPDRRTADALPVAVAQLQPARAVSSEQEPRGREPETPADAPAFAVPTTPAVPDQPPVRLVTVEREVIEAAAITAEPPPPAPERVTVIPAEQPNGTLAEPVADPTIAEPVVAQPPALPPRFDEPDTATPEPAAPEPPPLTIEIGEITIRVGAERPAERPATRLRAAGQGRVASLEDFLARRERGR